MHLRSLVFAAFSSASNLPASGPPARTPACSLARSSARPTATEPTSENRMERITIRKTLFFVELRSSINMKDSLIVEQQQQQHPFEREAFENSSFLLTDFVHKHTFRSLGINSCPYSIWNSCGEGELSTA